MAAWEDGWDPVGQGRRRSLLPSRTPSSAPAGCPKFRNAAGFGGTVVVVVVIIVIDIIVIGGRGGPTCSRALGLRARAAPAPAALR